jgi:hypothetical protein
MIVHKLELKTVTEWRAYCNSGKKPAGIPANPSGHYGKQFKSMGDWLGTGYVANKHRQYLPFVEAREFVRKLNLKSQTDWKRYKSNNNLPPNIPRSPQDTYADKGWTNWSDFLGSTNNVATKERKYLPFPQARQFVHKLGLTSQREWSQFCNSNEFPNNIPKTPRHYYKKSGWKSFGDWLGTNEIATFKREYLSFEVARANVRELRLRSRSEYANKRKSGELDERFHSAPDRFYKNSGWISWADWLGK